MLFFLFQSPGQCFQVPTVHCVYVSLRDCSSAKQIQVDSDNVETQSIVNICHVMLTLEPKTVYHIPSLIGPPNLINHIVTMMGL